MQSLRQWTCRGFGSIILTPQSFSESAWLRYHPGGITLARTIRVRAGAETEVPELLLRASSWIPVTKGSECSMNYDRPDVPPVLPPPAPLSISVAFLKWRPQGTVVQASHGSSMEGLGETERSTPVPW